MLVCASVLVSALLLAAVSVIHQAAQQREQVLEAKRVKRAAKKQLKFVQKLLAQPLQQQLEPTDPDQLSSSQRAAQKWVEKQQRKEEQQQQAAQEVEAKAELERKKAGALARLQAANVGRQSQQQKLTRPGLNRPAPPQGGAIAAMHESYE